jgi:hypothetical protein
MSHKKQTLPIFFSLVFIIACIGTIAWRTPRAYAEPKNLFGKPKQETILQQDNKEETQALRTAPGAFAGGVPSLPELAPYVAVDPQMKHYLVNNPQALNVPERLGVIKELHRDKNPKGLIIHIQDIHCNYEGQLNMARLINDIVRRYGVKLILVEGGSGNDSLTYMRNYASQETRYKVADDYLRQAKISGEEYLDICSDLPIQIQGIENNELYQANVDVFWKIEGFRAKADSYLDALDNVVINLKRRLYPPDLKKLDEAIVAYNANTMTLFDYVLGIDSLMKKLSFDISPYPQTKDFVDIARAKENVDLQAAEVERSVAINEISSSLSAKEKELLLAKLKALKASRIKQTEFYEMLESFALKTGYDLKEKKNLYGYISYIKKYEAADLAAFLRERSDVEDALAGKLFTDENQKRLYYISKEIPILRDFLSIELTPQDYTYFVAHKDQFITKNWLGFLEGLASMNNLRAPVPQDASVIDDNLTTLEEFYAIAQKRDHAFLENTLKTLREFNDNTALLIAGGYHTGPLMQLLKENGYSYIVITPITTKKTDSDLYLTVLKEKTKSSTQ